MACVLYVGSSPLHNTLLFLSPLPKPFSVFLPPLPISFNFLIPPPVHLVLFLFLAIHSFSLLPCSCIIFSSLKYPSPLSPIHFYIPTYISKFLISSSYNTVFHLHLHSPYLLINPHLTFLVPLSPTPSSLSFPHYPLAIYSCSFRLSTLTTKTKLSHYVDEIIAE